MRINLLPYKKKFLIETVKSKVQKNNMNHKLIIKLTFAWFLISNQKPLELDPWFSLTSQSYILGINLIYRPTINTYWLNTEIESFGKGLRILNFQRKYYFLWKTKTRLEQATFLIKVLVFKSKSIICFILFFSKLNYFLF